jgi:YCII-related domain
MIARGPTLAGDGDTPTGSVHIVGQPDPAAARAFAFDEPGYQAGVYRNVLLRRRVNGHATPPLTCRLRVASRLRQHVITTQVDLR